MVLCWCYKYIFSTIHCRLRRLRRRLRRRRRWHLPLGILLIWLAGYSLNLFSYFSLLFCCCSSIVYELIEWKWRRCHIHIAWNTSGSRKELGAFNPTPTRDIIRWVFSDTLMEICMWKGGCSGYWADITNWRKLISLCRFFLSQNFSIIN